MYSGMFVSGINGGACVWYAAHGQWGEAAINAAFSVAVFVLARGAS